MTKVPYIWDSYKKLFSSVPYGTCFYLALAFIFGALVFEVVLASLVSILIICFPPLLAYLFSFSPNIAFLSDVIGFEGAVIALAIPLSFEIVSRFSERYQSDVISRRFSERWFIRFLPYLLILCVIFSVCLRFRVGDLSTSFVWKVAAWATLALFIGTTLVFLKFINVLSSYISNPKEILDNLFYDAEKSIKG